MDPKSVRNERPGGPSVDAVALDAIGRVVKARYDHMIEAPLPERLRKLLTALRIKEASVSGNAAEGA
jgi:hypothetical protein